MGKFCLKKRSCRFIDRIVGLISDPLHVSLVHFCPLLPGKKCITSPQAKATKKKASPKAKAPTKTPKGSLKPAQDNILQTMGKLRAIGHNQPKRDQVQSFSGNTKTPEGFKKNMGILKKEGYLLFPSKDTVELTEQGLEYVGDVDPSSLSIDEFHENIKEMLPSQQAKQIFEMIKDGQVYNKKAIIEELGLDPKKLSGFEKNLSKMSSLGFVEKTKTTIQLTDTCFPLGRPN